MISLLAQSGHTQYGLREYVIDSEDDLDNLPVNQVPQGSYAFVIDTSEVYMFSASRGEWIKI